VPASPPQAAVDGQGRVAVVYRRPGSGSLSLVSQSQSGGTFRSPVDLSGPGGVGEPATVVSPADSKGLIMVFARNESGGVAAGRQTDSGFSSWTSIGGKTLGPPAAKTDSSSRVEVVTVGPSGVVVQRQASAGLNQNFSTPTEVGF